MFLRRNEIFEEKRGAFIAGCVAEFLSSFSALWDSQFSFGIVGPLPPRRRVRLCVSVGRGVRLYPTDRPSNETSQSTADMRGINYGNCHSDEE